MDRTGITGMFDIHLAFAIDEMTPGVSSAGGRGGRGVVPNAAQGTATSNDFPAPSILTAIQEQLGLKLEPVMGPKEFLVIDHVEKPAGN